MNSRLIWLLPILILIGLWAWLASASLSDVPHWGIDLFTFRAAARAMMVGDSPYHEPNIIRHAAGSRVGNIHDYIYAPYFAFFSRPLTWLLPETAARVWFALNLVLYFSSIGLIFLALRWLPRPRTFLVIMIGLVLYPPLRTTLIIGQSTILLLFSLALSIFFVQNKQPVIGGLVLSLGLFKPHLVLVPLFFLLHRRWRWLAGLGAGLAILYLPFISWMGEWIEAAVSVHASNMARDQCFQMVSLTSLLKCALNWPEILITALSLLGGIALIWGAWRSHLSGSDKSNNDPEKLYRHLALFIILGVLLLDHTRVADQMLLVFPLIVVWRDFSALKHPLFRRVSIALLLVVYLLPYSLDILGPTHIAFRLPFWYIGLTIALLGNLLLQSFGSKRDVVNA